MPVLQMRALRLSLFCLLLLVCSLRALFSFLYFSAISETGVYIVRKIIVSLPHLLSHVAFPR